MRRVGKVLLVLFGVLVVIGLILTGVQKAFKLGSYAPTRAITESEFRSVGRTVQLDTLKEVRDRLGKPVANVTVEPPSAKAECIYYHERGASSVSAAAGGSGKPSFQFCFVDGDFTSKRPLLLKTCQSSRGGADC